MDGAAWAVGARSPETAPVSEAEELSVILEATERGVERFVERARHAYEEQLVQAERMREVARSEVDKLGQLQRHIEPLIRSVQQSVLDARERIDRVPDQIQEAAGSMSEAITAVSESLDRLVAMPRLVSSGFGDRGGRPRDTGRSP